MSRQSWERPDWRHVGLSFGRQNRLLAMGQKVTAQNAQSHDPPAANSVYSGLRV